MKKARLYVFILITGSSLWGCATAYQDMRWMNKGFDELTKGNYGKAEEYLEKALSLNPDNPYALLNIGVVYHKTDRTEKAREMYDKVISLNPEEVAERTNRDWAKGKKLGEIAKRNLESL